MLLRDEEVAARCANPRRDLLKGLIWLFLGVAVCVFFGAQNGDISPTAGFVGVAIGLAYLTYYAIDGRRRTLASSTVQPPRS
jgi:hypothetical protein